MLLRGFFRLVLLLLVCNCSLLLHADDVLDSSSVSSALNCIRPANIRAHMRFLSDPLLQGRAPDTPGYTIAAHYVVTQLEALGLEPGANGTWYQSVPLRKSLLDQPRSSLTFVKEGKEHSLVDGQDYVLTANMTQQHVDLEAPIVFAGFGVTAPEEHYDDYAAIDVHGKIVAIFANAPPRFSTTVRA
jgi:hypothetical protein